MLQNPHAPNSHGLNPHAPNHPHGPCPTACKHHHHPAIPIAKLLMRNDGPNANDQGYQADLAHGLQGHGWCHFGADAADELSWHPSNSCLMWSKSPHSLIMPHVGQNLMNPNRFWWHTHRIIMPHVTQISWMPIGFDDTPIGLSCLMWPKSHECQ